MGGTEQDMASKTWKNAQPRQHVLQFAGGPIRNLNFNNKEKDDLGSEGKGLCVITSVRFSRGALNLRRTWPDKQATVYLLHLHHISPSTYLRM